ncbi:MAG: zinc-finger domain-containing protein [Parvibaculum sp.]|uniref:zinc-finger domain-containing protein n=1 Tax=Parvibaculum sp. TaxID=2024848 RepID=UPI0032EAA4BA|nr:zinc-finger domain-containing protein [Parvibaculum sp.]
MAGGAVPKFSNEAGAREIAIGVKEFTCIGANPPFDHPHIWLDMGSDAEIVCPYCSTLYRYDAALGAHESRPAEALIREKSSV